MKKMANITLNYIIMQKIDEICEERLYIRTLT